MLIIEPSDLFERRVEHRRQEAERERRKFWHDVHHPAEHEDGWDAPIIDFLAGQPEPVLIMRVVNRLVKSFRCKNRPDRERAKVVILRSLGRLVREHRLIRVRRRFVRLNPTARSTIRHTAFVPGVHPPPRNHEPG